MHYINYILVAAKLQSLEQLETLLFYNGYLLKKDYLAAHKRELK